MKEVVQIRKSERQGTHAPRNSSSRVINSGDVHSVAAEGEKGVTGEGMHGASLFISYDFLKEKRIMKMSIVGHPKLC